MGKRRFRCFKGGVTGDDFIGRQTQLQMLMRLADEEHPVHPAIYGLPHVGKTSLTMEWVRQLEKQNNRSNGGRKLLLVQQTVPTGILEQRRAEDYAVLLAYLLYDILSKIGIAQDCGDLPQTEELQERITELELATGVEDSGEQNNLSNEELTGLLEKTIHSIGMYGVRTVIVLDEFERAGQYWREEDFVRLMKVLMNDTLDLLCVVASRPHVEYVVSDYTQKILPFQPMRLDSFDDNDMKQYLEILSEAVAPEKLPVTDSKYLRDLSYVCGRNPFLLTVMASYIIKEPDKNPRTLFYENREPFKTHFEDVVDFMLYEEAREKKSFSHIVKCYFGTSDDYADIIDTYIRLSYIEINPVDSIYTYVDERYEYTDKTSGRKFSFVTVSPAFISYLYTEKLDEVQDVRDLLTGLVHTIRDITKLELEKIYRNTDWNIELLKRMRSMNQGQWLYAQQLPNGTWEITKQVNSQRQNWIQKNWAQMITVKMTSLNYAVMAVNGNLNRPEGRKRMMPVLDPINLADNGEMIIRYAHKFVPYFTVLGSIATEAGANRLRAHLEEIREARNEISHFSRDGMEEQDFELCRRRCIYLLRGIYSYLGDQTEMSFCEFN